VNAPDLMQEEPMNDKATMVKARRPSILKSARASALFGDTRGAGLVEYIILVGLIALAALAGFQYFGTQVNTKARKLGDRVTTEIP
jgi:pilus assembly protein Flp/PilA